MSRHPSSLSVHLCSALRLLPCLFFFLIFIFTLFYFTILYCFCHTLTWIHHGCTCVPKHEPLSHFPPHNISLGHHRAPAPSMLYPASDIDWRCDSYMIVYMFQCHSPKSSHPLPLPDDPVCKTAKKTQMCITDFWTWRGRGWDDLGEWHCNMYTIM